MTRDFAKCVLKNKYLKLLGIGLDDLSSQATNNVVHQQFTSFRVNGDLLPSGLRYVRLVADLCRVIWYGSCTGGGALRLGTHGAFRRLLFDLERLSASTRIPG